MSGEPHCDSEWMSSQDPTGEETQPIRLERVRFLAQLANALTVLNGWTHLAQVTSCRTRQQRYLETMQQTVQHITQLMQHHRRSR